VKADESRSGEFAGDRVGRIASLWEVDEGGGGLFEEFRGG